MKNTILSYLPEDFPWQVHWFQTIDSTNNEAKRMAAAGAPHCTVLISAHQSGGRGRMGRSFSSPAGQGLYLSVILRPDCTAEQLMHLTCAAGVAACEAIYECCGITPGIKWINDLVLERRKLGGILTELSVDPKDGKVSYAIIGIGINCMQRPEDFPTELQSIATSLRCAGIEPNIPQLAAALIRSLQRMSDTIQDRSAIMEIYKKHCITLGQEISVIKNTDISYGTAFDLTEDGALLVRFSDGKIAAVNSGEVSIRGMYGYI